MAASSSIPLFPSSLMSMSYFDQRQHQAAPKPSKYRLIRSPRFVKQLSDIRAAGRQQLLQINNNFNGSGGEQQQAGGNISCNNNKRFSPTSTAVEPPASSLLLMMTAGAFPSPRSSSTTASNDNLQNASTALRLPQASSFVSTQKVEFTPKTLLVVPQAFSSSSSSSSTNPNVIISGNNGASTTRDAPGPGINNPNHQLEAISCLASPPWTRSTSPASPRSNSNNSLSPPPGFTFGPQAPVILPCSPPLQMAVIRTHAEPVVARKTSPPHEEPPQYSFLRKRPEPPAADELPPPERAPPPPPPPLPPQPVTPNLTRKKSAITPCQLISTTVRPAQKQARSRSLTAFCSNESDDAEPFTLVPLPDVDPREFPEQSWAYRNVRKLVSRLSAYVKARRRGSSPQSLRSAASSDAFITSEGEEMMVEDEIENDGHDSRRETQQELANLAQIVREQFGGSLSSLLKSAPRSRSGSQPVIISSNNHRIIEGPIATSSKNRQLAASSLTLSSGRTVPTVRSVPSSHFPPRVPMGPRTHKPQIVTKSQENNRKSLVVTSCQNNPTRCLKCHYCTVYLQEEMNDPQMTPMSRYGLRGQHIHLPPEELDLTAKPLRDDSNNLFDSEDFDETQVPRSALSPEFSFADPLADDMFQRSIRAVRF